MIIMTLSKYENTYEIIRGPYYSNCIIEALKAKLKNLHTKFYLCMPYKKKSGKIGSMHALWEDDNYSYDFSDIDWSDNKGWWSYFWYEGYIRRWPKEFARDYKEYRKSVSRNKT